MDQSEGTPPADWSLTAKHLSKMTQMTLEMEFARESSLRSLAGILLTGASIVSIALLTAATPLFKFFASEPFWWRMLLGVYCLSLGALILAVLLAVLSQMRFGYKALPSPEGIRKQIDDGVPFDEMDTARNENQSLQPIYASYSQKNDTMRYLLKASMICIVIALAVIAVGGGVLAAYAFGAA